MNISIRLIKYDQNFFFRNFYFSEFKKKSKNLQSHSATFLLILAPSKRSKKPIFQTCRTPRDYHKSTCESKTRQQEGGWKQARRSTGNDLPSVLSRKTPSTAIWGPRVWATALSLFPFQFTGSSVYISWGSAYSNLVSPHIRDDQILFQNHSNRLFILKYQSKLLNSKNESIDSSSKDGFDYFSCLGAYFFALTELYKNGSRSPWNLACQKSPVDFRFFVCPETLSHGG